MTQPTEELGTEEYTHTAIISKNAEQTPSYLDLVVTYYSDPRDKIPHVPMVCYRGQGGSIVEMSDITVESPQLAPKYPTIPARLMLFQWSKTNEIVMYCFIVEGQLCNSREVARWLIGKPGNRYTYYCNIKVGARCPIGSKPDEAVDMCKTLLCEAMDVLIKEYLPREEQLKRH